MDKKRKLRIYSGVLAAILSTSSLAGCGKLEEKKSSVQYQSDLFNHFDFYIKYIVNENGKLVKEYKTENVALAFDKETNEITGEYIYNNILATELLEDNIMNPTSLKRLGNITELYNINSEALEFFYSDTDNDYIIGYEQFNDILEKNNIIILSNIDSVLSDEKLDKYISKEEIKELENKISNHLNKVKKLSKRD